MAVFIGLPAGLILAISDARKRQRGAWTALIQAPIILGIGTLIFCAPVAIQVLSQPANWGLQEGQTNEYLMRGVGAVVGACLGLVISGMFMTNEFIVARASGVPLRGAQTPASSASLTDQNATPFDEDLYQRIRAELQKAGEPGSPSKGYGNARTLGLLIVTFLLFALLAAISMRKSEVAFLLGTLLLHEGGHYAGMRYFGYRDVRMFFIPFLGAAVAGEKKEAPPWQQAIVLLLGPLPGLLLGCGIYFAALIVPLEPWRAGAVWLVSLNFLNLMPLWPLDGGKLCQLLMFKRARLLEALATIVTAVGFAFLCLAPQWWCVAIIIALAVFLWAPRTYRRATAALVFQSHWTDLPFELRNLDDERMRDLFRLTRGSFGDKTLATQMKQVYERALEKPVGNSPGELALLGTYLGAILLALVTASVTPLSDDAGRWPLRIREHLGVPAEKTTAAEHWHR
jgi:Zn-dependent protease